jgi:hypothetical protein
MSARLLLVRLVLRAVSGRAGRSAQAAERHLSVGMDFLRFLLLAQRQRCGCAGAARPRGPAYWLVERAPARREEMR